MKLLSFRVLSFKIPSVIVLSIMLLPPFVFGKQPSLAQNEEVGADTHLQELARNLGVSHKEMSDLTGDFDLLAANPHLAAKLLTKELHQIPRKTYYPSEKTEESRHVLNCLRALRYLTGKTFSASTKEKLAPDESQFLDFNTEMRDANPGHKIHFFGVWMSRDAEFVAPLDAQEKIIDQWKQWQKEYGDSFVHSVPKAKDCMDAWVWFG
jgi:hypothetical protein